MSMRFRSIVPSIHGSAKVTRLLSAFRRDCRGSIATLLGLCAVPLICFAGASVDYSRALSGKTAMQGAADATALALAKQIQAGTSGLEAQPAFNANFTRGDVQIASVASNVTSSANTNTVTVSATGSIKTAFMQIVGFPSISLQATSTASVQTGMTGCVLALDTQADNAVTMGGSTNVSLSNCSVYSNSQSATALSVSGTATLTAESIGAVGGISVSSSNVTTTDGIQPHLQGLTDPYADVQLPSYTGCTQNNLSVKTTATIDPGVYCNGISVNAGATLTLNPGVYFIDRGTLSVNGGGTINGTGVTLVFTSSTGNNWATLTINGNAVVNLTAPIGGTTAGLVVFGDRNSPVGTAFKLNGGSTQTFGGAIYVPTGAISYSGGSGTSTSCTQIIGDTVTFTGNSSVAINCNSYQTKPFGPTSLRLIS
jgi:Flp pilus assembly protein TadG